MKGKKILGIPLTLLVLGLMVIGGASAALVGYFASVTTTVIVEAPITLRDDLFTIDSEDLIDGQNHYLLIKGNNRLGIEVPATAVITIKRDGAEITDTTGIHLAIDAGGDMHYCYDLLGEMTNVEDCDVDYVQWLENNPDWFDWLGTDSTYELSGFESPIINHGGNSWFTIEQAEGTWENGVMTLPGIDPAPGLFAALLVVRADPGIKLGTYTIEVELIPVV